MFELTLVPRFYETDAFGHINNTTVAGWFETGRAPVFQLFSTGQNAASLPLILARIEIDFVAQLYYGADVLVRTGIGQIGNSSFTVLQQAWQNGTLAARGRAVQVYFDHQTQASQPLTATLREQLAVHLIPDEERK
jgi:acyl-CoA thioester hydrolase